MLDIAKYAEGHLLVEVKEQIAVATLNRPERLNAVADGLHEALETFFHDVNADPEVNVIVLTGAGRGFCGGGDMKMMAARPDDAPWEPMQLFRGPKWVIQRMLNCEQPIIAAINGPAAGFGATLALCCDVTFMADTARIGDSHVVGGLTAGDGGAIVWPLLVGPSRAKDMLMTGRLLTGEEAGAMGVVNYVMPAETLMDEAMAYARKLADGPTLAIRLSKMAVNRHLWQSLQNTFDFSLAAEAISSRSLDHREASRAFAEKRTPKYQGR